MKRQLLLSICILLLSGLCVSCRDESFQSKIEPIPPEVRTKMLNKSWDPKCPVTLDELAYIRMTYWDFQGQRQEGVLVTNKLLAEEIVVIFRELFKMKFPIERMQPYEEFEVEKYADNNATVGFYFRPAQDKPSEYSIHSWGYAIDINPMINPFCDPKEGWWPAGSEKYNSRDPSGKGKIVYPSKVFEVFTRHGWVWGGMGRNADYMHFEKGLIGHRSDPQTKWYFTRELSYGKP